MKTIIATLLLLSISSIPVLAEPQEESSAPQQPPIEVRRPAKKPGDMHLEMHSTPAEATAPASDSSSTTVLPVYQSTQLQGLTATHPDRLEPYGPTYRAATYGQTQTGEGFGFPYYP
jgi:hypothetical protein